jgi:tetratricopeptide (TPR) repeat protein
MNRRLLLLLVCGLAGALGTARAAEVDEEYREAILQGVRNARKGENARALARFRQARDLKPRSAEAYYRLALTFNDLAMYSSAEEHARNATVLDEDYAPGWLVLGQALFHLNREEEALRALRRALRLDPESPHAPYLIGRCHYFLADAHRLRVEELQRTRQREGATEELELRIRQAQQRAREAYTEALEYFRQTLRLAPRYNPARFMEGCCLLELGLPDPARLSFSELLRSEPENPELHFRLGLCYLESDRHLDAERAFQEALRKDPDHIDAHYLLGRLYDRHLGDPEQAGLHYKRFLDNAAEGHPARGRARQRYRGLAQE